MTEASGRGTITAERAPASADDSLDGLLKQIRACRRCLDAPLATPLPHEPRPVLRASATARILVASQAPGTKVHLTGITFNDASGDRLRDWMGVTWDEFYDEARVAIIPMGFCFPGQDAAGGDLPPRRECGATWHDRLFARLPTFDLVLAIGRPAQLYQLRRLGRHDQIAPTLTETVARWRQVRASSAAPPKVYALPHPSWRNTGWIKRNPWFEAELLPELRADIATALGAPPHERVSSDGRGMA